jgi:hypothetical protein
MANHILKDLIHHNVHPWYHKACHLIRYTSIKAVLEVRINTEEWPFIQGHLVNSYGLGGPMMMRYPPEMVSPNMSPTPVMMQPGQPHSTPPPMHPQAAPIPRPSGIENGGRSPYTSPQNLTPTMSSPQSNPHETSPRVWRVEAMVSQV